MGMKEMMWSRKSTVSSVESALQGARLGLLQWCKLWGQKLLDGLHALALIEMPPMDWNHRGVCRWLEMSLYSFTPEVPESGIIIWAGLMESSLVRVLG